jgi:SRSO17 transposase
VIVDQQDSGTAAPLMVEAVGVREKLDEVMAALAPLFARVEPRRNARAYVEGLLSDTPRKNCWQLAEHAGHSTPDRMQWLLERASWDAFAAMDAVSKFTVRHLADDGLTVAVLDESGQCKQGSGTAGVKPQYVGCVGGVANAVNFVNLTYSTPRGHALIGSRLYVPAEQLTDTAGRDAMGIPTDLTFATKPELGVQLLSAQLAADVRLDWCAADEVYGRDPQLREFCHQHQIGYVLGVPVNFPITLPSGRKIRADASLQLLEASMWTIASAGAGSKGDRRYAWAWLATTSPRHYLLIRRNLTTPNEVAYFFCYVPPDQPATLPILAAVAGRRWTVEEDHEFGKDLFGYDHSQVRLYTAIHRHLALVTAALAICATAAADARDRTNNLPPPPTHPDQPPPANPGLIPLTVAELKRLYNLLTRTLNNTAHHLHWNWWRRRHQARARWHHHRTRLRREIAAT